MSRPTLALAGAGTHGCIVRPAVFSPGRQLGARDPRQYVTKVFFTARSFQEEKQTNDRIRPLFRGPHADLLLDALEDTMDAGTASRIIGMEKLIGGWGVTARSVGVIHYLYAGQDLKSKPQPNAVLVQRVMRSLFETVKVLSASMCIHRDIKMENVLVESNGRVRLIDYGIAAFVHPAGRFPAYTNWAPGVHYYDPPESVLNGASAAVRSFFRGLDDPRPARDAGLDRIVKDRALCLVGAPLAGDRLEAALQAAGLHGEREAKREESKRVRSPRSRSPSPQSRSRSRSRSPRGGSRPAPSTTRSARMIGAIAAAMRPLEASLYDTALNPRTSPTDRRSLMSNLVVAYNAYQVGHLLLSLIRRIASPVGRDVALLASLRSIAEGLMDLSPIRRVHYWNSIATKLHQAANKQTERFRAGRRGPSTQTGQWVVYPGLRLSVLSGN